MNLKATERLLLLEQSGELTPAQRRALDAELATSATARLRRDQLRLIADAIPPPPTAPAPDAARQLAARLTAPRPARFGAAARNAALAAAAALALLLGIRAHRSPSSAPPPLAAAAAEHLEDDAWEDPLESDFADLETLMLAVLEYELDFSDL